jgi:phage shock protein A
MEQARKNDSSWLLVSDDKNIENLVAIVSQVAQSQQETALALQKLLSGLSEKMDKLSVRFAAMQEKIAALEHRMLENDIREQNRRLRTHDAFSFQARKMANP